MIEQALLSADNETTSLYALSRMSSFCPSIFPLNLEIAKETNNENNKQQMAERKSVQLTTMNFYKGKMATWKNAIFIN